MLRTKKIKSLLLGAVLTATSIVGMTGSALAATSGSCTVTATKAANYSITVPSTLDVSSGTANYTINVSGDIGSAQSVTVAPTATTFDLKDTSSETTKKPDITATITQTATPLDMKTVESGGTQTGSITAPITAGTWSGTCSFTATIK